MGTCPHCGKEIRDGAWACGFCGEPVATAIAPSEDAGDDASAPSVLGQDGLEYATAVAPSPATAKPQRASRLLWLVLGAGAVAVLAIVLVWLFVLRDAGRGPFVGTWKLPGNDIARLRIEEKGGYELTFTDGQGRSIGPFIATLNGVRLETKLQLKSGGGGTQGVATQLFQSVLTSMLGDFTISFAPTTRDDRLTMGIEGPNVPQTPAYAPVELQRTD
jgi:hypothetical protein